MKSRLLVSSLVLSILSFVEGQDDFEIGQFPDGFKWGVATSAYQIEGGWDADGKGPSIWDTFAHEKRLTNGDTGDVACDSYHKYKEDVKLLKQLGVAYYRFSIAWSRILPDGTRSHINAAGINYYNKLIDELLRNGIEPMVTLYHWDLPQALENHGGWKNDSIIQWFDDYASLCYERFGDRVKMWITFNEAYVVSWLGYGIGIFAPGVKEPGTGVYRVTHNIIRSHAKAYHSYDDHYRATQNGKVGITLDCDWKEPKTNSTEDIAAAERALQFKLGWFANPIFGNGDYPDVMKEYVGRKSTAQGLQESRLPVFTDGEKNFNRGSADFFGLNHYTTQYVNHSDRGTSDVNYEVDQDLQISQDPSWPSSQADWLKVVPWGLRKLVKWVTDTYSSPNIYITENGVSDAGCLADLSRVKYLRGYINELLKAIKYDNCKVQGYLAWALMDNLEWTSAYTQKFGLYHVDFTNPARPRTAKDSARYYRRLVQNNGFNRDDKMLYPKIYDDKYNDDAVYNKSLPKNFYWGASTVAYQVEGGWNADGKGPSIWDTYAHSGKMGTDGDVASDSYHNYMDDVAIAKNLTLDSYRFTLSWPRILPDGTTKYVNTPGIKYYNNLIDALLAAGVQPMVAMYDSDLPQALQDEGGWNNSAIIQHFVQYARLCLEQFGDRVKIWTTLNEPWTQATLGYGNKVHPPAINDPGYVIYRVAHNMIKAHVKTYRLFEKYFKKRYNAMMGISNIADWKEPKTSFVLDKYAADRAMQFQLGWFSQPIFGNGDYPTVMKAAIRRRSGGTSSRLPSFTKTEKEENKGAADFMGLNHYNTEYVKNKAQPNKVADYNLDQEKEASFDDCWERTSVDWYRSVPWGLRKVLKWIKDRYSNPPVIITENGISNTSPPREDKKRAEFIVQSTTEVLKANVLDGCDVRGYFYAMMIDGVTWTANAGHGFGLYSVDYTNTYRTRTARWPSAMYYKMIIQRHKLLN